MDHNEDERGSSKRGLTTIAVVAVIIVIAVSVMLFSNKKDDTASTTPSPASSTTSPSVKAATADTATASSAYKDGSYSATGSYSTPGGTETIKVTLTVKDGAVTASNVVSGADNPESTRYQGDFISGYKQFVEGKKLDDIAVSNVSGSSLTPKGFANALGQIKTEAKA